MVYYQLFLFLILQGYFLWVLRNISLFGSRGNYHSWSEPNSYPPQLTVIVPFKNESTNLPKLLYSIEMAIKPLENAEVLFIDDHSSDDGVALIESFGNECFKVVSNNGSGKKSALETGIKNARYNSIFTTDADCELLESCFVGLPVDPKAGVMVCGAVIVKYTRGFLAAFQHVESLILAFLNGSHLKGNRALTCSGANLFYSKNLFEDVRPYEANKHIKSGDDHFFLHKVIEQSAGEVYWNPNRDPVLTQPKTSWKSLFIQKARWAGKLKSGGGGHSFLTGLFLALVQIVFLISLFQGVWTGDVLLLTFAGTKVLTDIMVFIVSKHFYQSPLSIVYAVVSSFLYAFYFIVVLIFALTRTSGLKNE